MVAEGQRCVDSGDVATANETGSVEMNKVVAEMKLWLPQACVMCQL